MASEKKRKGRGKNITSALELLDREPYRTIIEIIHLFGEAAPWQIIYVSNNENEKELTQRERGKLQRLRRINKYKKEGNEVKQLIHSRPDNPPCYPLNSDNLKKYLNTLIQWGIVEKIERGSYRIAPSLKNEIARKSNTRIIDSYARDDISDFSESNLIVYGFEHFCKQLEEADRSEDAQKLAANLLADYPDIYWFSISTKFEEDLNKGIIPEELKKKFESCYKRMYDEETPFSDSATVTKGEGDEWQIDDEGWEYSIRKEDGELKIYDSYAAQRRTGKDYITKIKERLENIEYELGALQTEARRAVTYLANVDSELFEKHSNNLKKSIPFLRPRSPFISSLSNISLFYSEKLGFNLPPSIELEISVSRWRRFLRDKTSSEEDGEKLAMELYQEHGKEILWCIPGPSLRQYIARGWRKKKR